MKLSGEIIKVEERVVALEVTVTNVREVGAAAWKDYGPEMAFVVPHARVKSYLVGRKVKITIEPEST